MKFNLISIIFLILLSTNSIAQDNGLHHRKYWWYKSRLNNDFLKVGIGDGESIPFMQRGFNANQFNSYVATLNTGDAAGMVGYYIAMLATEYKLLVKNGNLCFSN